MGYTVTASCKSKKALQTVQAFLEANYRPWSELDPEYPECYDFTKFFRTGDDLAYDHGATKIGFNWSTAGGPIRNYMFTTIAWIALKVGRQMKTDHGKAYYIIYDGYDKWPLHVQQEDDLPFRSDRGGEWIACDKNGFKRHPELRYYVEKWGREADIHQEIAEIHKSLGELTEDHPLLEWFTNRLNGDISLRKEILRTWEMDRVIQAELQRLSDLWDQSIAQY